MPRIAMAAPATDEDASSTRVDDLIQRGRSQGHLSLSDLRIAFEQAGLTPAEARSILRELSEAGVRLADEGTEKGADIAAAISLTATASGTATVKGTAAKATAAKKGRSKKASADTGTSGSADGADGDPELADDEVASIEADVAAIADAVDLDDQTPAMGDSVHTYLKSIGRTSLLTAEQEVDLAKRIEAGLFAEHKLETLGLDGRAGLDEDYRRDLEMVAEDGRRAKAHMLEANLRLVVSVAKKYSDRGLSLLDVVQ